MNEILKRDTSLARKLVQPNSDMMFSGVLAGNNTGRVWVDNPDTPSFALVWSDGLGCFQFMGSESNHVFSKELKVFIETTVKSFLSEKGFSCFEFSADTEELFLSINKTLANREIDESWQLVYKSGINPEANISLILPKPYSIRKIDENFILSITRDKAVSNPEFLIDYIEQFWGSVENYLQLGNGYGAVVDSELVSFGITSFLYDKTFSLGVETLEQHRRKGLASSLINILLKDLYSEGYSIWWDCMESNIPSQKTAESVGLSFSHKYKVCWFNF